MPPCTCLPEGSANDASLVKVLLSQAKGKLQQRSSVQFRFILQESSAAQHAFCKHGTSSVGTRECPVPNLLS